MKKALSIALLAVAGAALFSTSAKAQFSGTYTQGDMLLGFRVSGGTGAGTDVLVDLGSINYSNKTTFSTPNLGSLLTSTFGSGWYTRSDLFWGGAAGAVSPSTLLYGTSAETIGGSESTVWVDPSTTQANQLRGKINGEGQAYQNGSPTTSAPALTQIESSSNSYSSYQPGGANSSGIGYAYFNPTVEATNPSVTTLDVIQIAPPAGGGTVGAPGIDVGDLTISSTGVVTFTPDSLEAIPEPSVTALVAFAALGLILFAVHRRAIKAS